MPRDLPDWGALSAQATVYEVSDLGELAARLGSLDTFDRRGDLIWGDGFECGLAKWITTVVGTGASAAVSTARARNGRYSCLLTAGSDSGRSAQIEHFYAFPALSRLGFEISFARDTTIQDLRLEVDILTGSRNLLAGVRFVEADAELTYWNAAGGQTAFASGVDLANNSYLFHTLKLVIDLVAEEYTRVVFDSVEYSLTGVAIEAAAATDPARAEVFVRATGQAGFNRQVYVDDVILTQNEPA